MIIEHESDVYMFLFSNFRLREEVAMRMVDASADIINKAITEGQQVQNVAVKIVDEEKGRLGEDIPANYFRDEDDNDDEFSE